MIKHHQSIALALDESKAGGVAWSRESGKPRGGHVWTGSRGEFKGGKVTIAVSNFPMNNQPDDRFIPARAPLSVWLQEMKLPLVGERINRNTTKSANEQSEAPAFI